MYILLKDTVPVGLAINSAAHASLIAYLAWHGRREFDNWLVNSFRKVTCKVTSEEFEKAKTYSTHLVIKEGNEEVAIVFLPTEKNGFLRGLKLYD